MIQRLAPDQSEADVHAALSRYGLGTAVDVVYVPMNRKRTSNLGYAFVNFATVESTQECLNVISGRSLGRLTGNRPCRAAFSKMQGASFLRRRAEIKAQEVNARAEQQSAAQPAAVELGGASTELHAALAASAMRAAMHGPRVSDEVPADLQQAPCLASQCADVVVLGAPVSL